MTKKRYIIYLLLSLAHSFLFVVIPDYSFDIFPFIWLLWALVSIATVVVDLFDKTHLWKGAFYCLGLGIVSWFFGFFLQDIFI